MISIFVHPLFMNFQILVPEKTVHFGVLNLLNCVFSPDPKFENKLALRSPVNIFSGVFKTLLEYYQFILNRA